MQRLLAYHFSSSEESSSDESQTAESFQLRASSKKLCTSHERIALQPERTTPSPSSNLQLQEQQIHDAELQGNQEQNPAKDEPQQQEEQELEDFAEEFHEQEEELQVEQEQSSHLQGDDICKETTPVFRPPEKSDRKHTPWTRKNCP